MMIIIGCILGAIIGVMSSYLMLAFYFDQRQKYENSKEITNSPSIKYKPFTERQLQKIEEEQKVFRRSDEIVAYEEDRE